MQLLRQITRESQSGPDVFGLRALVSGCQKNNHLSPSPLEVHPVTGAVMDSQLRNTFAHWLNISGISQRESFDPGLDTRSCLNVSQAVKPLSR